MYIEFYLFNWTNADEVVKDWKIKPIFEECGPYTYSEHHVRVNIKWNDNGTLSYQQKRFWKYLPEKSKGSLTDKIVNLNIVVATVAYTVKDEHYLVKRGVDFFLKEKEGSLISTHTVKELLFEGYEDKLLVLAKELNISRLNIPFDRFGWFYGVSIYYHPYRTFVLFVSSRFRETDQKLMMEISQCTLVKRIY